MTSEGEDERRQWHRDDDVTARDDLDLEACLEAAEHLQDEVSQHLYSDPDMSPQNSSWVEDVIEMTSSQEVTSAGDHAEEDEFASGDNPGTSRELGQGHSASRANARVDLANVYGAHLIAVHGSSSFFPVNLVVQERCDSSAQDLGGRFEVPHSVLSDSRHQTTSAPSSTSASSASSSSSSSSSSSLGLRQSCSGGGGVSADFWSQEGSRNWGSSSSSRSTDLRSLTSQQASTSSDPSGEGASGNQQSARLKSLLKWKLRSKNSNTVSSCVGGHREDKEKEEQARGDVQTRSRSTSSVASSSQDSDVTRGLPPRSVSSSPSSLMTVHSTEEDDQDIEDRVKLQEKREKNRLAAQKSRDKKRDRREKLEQHVCRLEERQERLRQEVRRLRDERETLQDLMAVHSTVCPHMPRPPPADDAANS
ncbi:uncharacterized protein LOC143296628 [Babylonia areolata]|uniref:uncharacterized protein LOC143296628 n=1 Tax=Babylonia areolata TaxID=304850 RepID=UPI003FD3F953